MAQKLLSASGAIKGTKDVRVYHLVLSGTANATATLKIGGSGGSATGPVVRTLANTSVEVHFPGGVLCDYITLSGAGVNCWVSFS